MQEKVIAFDATNPTEIFGINNANINFLKSHFSKLKVIARGSELKILGAKSDMEQFEKTIGLMVEHYGHYHKLSLENVKDLVKGKSTIEKSTISDEQKPNSKGLIVFGSEGEPIKARTVNQQKIVDSIDQYDMVFAIGPAGTGKTYTSVALAVRALKNKEVKRIILTRPAVEAGESLGFLPGDLKDKLDPYLQPLYDALRDMLPPEKLNAYMENGTIQIAPLAFMRGRTLDHAFVILDEAQNASQSQLKMFLTRMGKSAKFIITGDLTQIDLPKHQPSGLFQAIDILKDVDIIKIVRLDDRDVIRHELVKRIIEKYDLQENKK